jgi:Flp pilus assembly pilin Flp
MQLWMRLVAWVSRRGDQGNSFVEYALIVALIVMVCLGAMTVLGGETSASADASASSIMLAN